MLIIKDGEIVSPDRIFKADIVVEDGVISAITESCNEKNAEIIDASGKLVFPGFIDSHAHLNDPGFTWREDFPHASAAAAAGGVTTIIDMPLQNEPALTSAEIFERKESAINGRSHVDYAFWGGLTPNCIDNIPGMNEAGAVAYKAFIGPVSPDYASAGMGDILKALKIIKTFDGLAGFHCEDFSIIKTGEALAIAQNRNTRQGFLESRPLAAEIIATQNVIELARETGANVHICHVSHPDVAELIRKARADGVAVTGETCPHYLTFSDEDFIKHGTIFKCAPPLRSQKAREKLWEYVINGTISCIGSDHSPCRADEKDETLHGVLGAWGGISGIQNIMQVLFDQGVKKRGFSPKFMARCSKETARIFSLPGKGEIQVGNDADIVIFDPEIEWEITSDSLLYLNKISAFVGLKGKGAPVCTMVRGRDLGDAKGRLVKRKK